MARYVIDPARSKVWIEARSNVHPIHSETDGLEGFVQLEFRADGAVDQSAGSAGHVRLPVDRLKSGNRLEDRELQKRIDAKAFPDITGELDRLAENESDGSYLVSGDVTFRGVTRRHEDLMTITEVDEHTVRLEGESRFDIREFGMQPPKVLMLRVEPVVDIRVEIYAVKNAGE